MVANVVSGDPKLIGILGGTFDPVHVGHIRLAVELKEKLGLDQMRLIPVGVPNHRAQPQASASERVLMLTEAVKSLGLLIDERELQRGGVSYMVDTLGSLKQEFPGYGLCLILGLDAYKGLRGWHRWQDLFQFCHIVVASRLDPVTADDDELQAFTNNRIAKSVAELKNAESGKVIFVNIPFLEISSTDIRHRIREGRDIAYLVPNAVKTIIEQRKLYEIGE